MFKYPEEAHFAVLGETIRRLYAQNPISEYPDWLKPFAEKLHSEQYWFYRGMLEHAGMSETEAADFMLKKGYTKFKEEKIPDKVREELHLDGNYFSEKEYPVLSDEIRKIGDLESSELTDLGKSTRILTSYISEAESPEEGIEFGLKDKNKYNSKYLDFFLDGIADYRARTQKTVDNFGNQLRTIVERIK